VFRLYTLTWPPLIPTDDRYIHPQQEAFSIQLISPVSWEAIPNAR
jgi:cleavage and polyadenylation specificity factor subunit 1